MMQKIFLSELNLLKEIAETLNEGTMIEPVLDQVLNKLLQLTSLETGWIFLIDKNGDYELAASVSLPPALKNPTYQPMCSGDCWCVNRFRKGELNKASNIMECKRLENARKLNWGETNGLTYHATVPLTAGKEHFGLLNVAVTSKDKFEPEELALLESIALQIGTALKRIRLTEEEKKMQLVRERNRLARDLHDSVNQLLYSISLTSRAGLKRSTNPELQEMFSDIQQMSQTAQNEMKALIWQLNPSGLEKGLIAALKSYSKLLGLNLEVSVSGMSTVPAKLEEALWRIGQEAFNNCLKYSGAKDIRLELSYFKQHVTMIISDNGQGFHSDHIHDLPSRGLKGIKERVYSLGGTVNISSSIGIGTTLTVEIPYK